jgi:uncharacterized protein YndB with AHSA1/START domain
LHVAAAKRYFLIASWLCNARRRNPEVRHFHADETEFDMAEILLDFPIKASPERVFRAISTPAGLDTWWTKESAGQPRKGAAFDLLFGPGYAWRGVVTRYLPDAAFELKMVEADNDWLGTLVGFRLEPRAGGTWVQFYHTGWPGSNEHYRISCNCWAMYLRVLRRSLEFGESVAYEYRLDV